MRERQLSDVFSDQEAVRLEKAAIMERFSALQEAGNLLDNRSQRFIGEIAVYRCRLATEAAYRQCCQAYHTRIRLQLPSTRLPEASIFPAANFVAAQDRCLSL